MSPRPSTDQRLQALREAGACGQDPVGWHYLQTLASRSMDLSGKAQALLQDRLHQALDAFEARLQDVPTRPVAATAKPSPLAQLVQDMRPMTAAAPASALARQRGGGLPPENPRVRQFRQQLRKISVQKQVRQAIAQAPHNAGPINSHMLVLRALAWMQEISPDYLNRFMTHLDTLLCLEATEQAAMQVRKKTPDSKSRSSS